MSKALKTYNPVGIIKDQSEYIGMVEHDCGEWVRWEDHKTLLEEQYVALSTLKKLEDIARCCEGLAIKYFEAMEFLKEEVE